VILLLILNEHTGETGSRITKGYMTLVTEKLPNIHYRNQGHNGWTSGEIAEEFDSLMLKSRMFIQFFLAPTTGGVDGLSAQ
jgi:hypothetical protein